MKKKVMQILQGDSLMALGMTRVWVLLFYNRGFGFRLHNEQKSWNFTSTHLHTWLWGAASEKSVCHGHIQGPHREAKKVFVVLLFVYILPENSKLTLSDMFLISQW